MLIFTGDRVAPAPISRLHQAGVLPAQVQGPEEPGVYRLAEWSKDHPIFEPFDQPEHGDLRALTFARITRLVPEPGARTLASAEGKRPLIVESTAGRGRCLIVAVPADNAWGDWAIGRLYLPLIHQLVGYLADRVPESGEGTGLSPRIQVPVTALPESRSTADGAVVRTSIRPNRTSSGPRPRRSARRIGCRSSHGLATRDAERRDSPSRQASVPMSSGRWIISALLAVLVVETFVANRTYA